jgi:hypothetical protein
MVNGKFQDCVQGSTSIWTTGAATQSPPQIEGNHALICITQHLGCLEMANKIETLKHMLLLL